MPPLPEVHESSSCGTTPLQRDVERHGAKKSVHTGGELVLSVRHPGSPVNSDKLKGALSTGLREGQEEPLNLQTAWGRAAQVPPLCAPH